MEGRDHLRKGNIAEALLCADTTIGLAPPDGQLLADGWSLHGQVRLLQGNPQAARAAFSRALDANPAHVNARLGLAEAYHAMKHTSRAIPLYLEALTLATEEAEKGRVRLLLADTYRALGKADAARAVLRANNVGRMKLGDRLRVLPRLLLPATPIGWLLLLVALLGLLVIALEVQISVALLTFALATVGYLLFLGWRTPNV
ncbi:MAG: tetratricopeptide repeat protein [Chloroflexota bacterium]|nr:tetratricopeptide repeat protein [Chloroflexota bacterium]